MQWWPWKDRKTRVAVVTLPATRTMRDIAVPAKCELISNLCSKIQAIQNTFNHTRIAAHKSQEII